jgi:hypothetical protein
MKKGASSCVFCWRGGRRANKTHKNWHLFFVCWVSLTYTAVRRKVSAVCYDNYWNHWVKDMHIKDR